MAQTRSAARSRNGAGSQSRRGGASSRRSSAARRAQAKSRPESSKLPSAESLKTSAIAGGAALAGLAGGLALAARGSRGKILGVKVPGTKGASANLAEAAKQLGEFGERFGELACEVRQAREGMAQGRTRSPIEVVLQGLTSRR